MYTPTMKTVVRRYGYMSFLFIIQNRLSKKKKMKREIQSVNTYELPGKRFFFLNKFVPVYFRQIYTQNR